MKILFSKYDGLNKEILILITFLEKNLKQYLAGAYIHGSIGSSEEILYSDFDALAIFNNYVNKDPKLIKKVLRLLKKTNKNIFKIDPLQHHGWFILNELDLDQFPEHYLPVEVLRHAKSLFSDIGTELDLNPVFIKDKIMGNFIKLASSIHGKLKSKKQPRNLYLLKGLLSQFMLMPTLYIQVRDNRGVYKKQSFDLARRDFSAHEWAIMDEVSNIRLNWHYSINALQRWLLTRTGRIRTYCARYMPMAIPKDIKSQLTPDFYHRMESLVIAMERKVL